MNKGIGTRNDRFSIQLIFDKKFLVAELAQVEVGCTERAAVQ